MLELFQNIDLLQDYIWDDWEKLDLALKEKRLDIQPNEVETILSRLRWIEYQQTGEGKQALRWVEPMRHTLMLLAESNKELITT